MSDDTQRELAIKRLREKRAFKASVASYVVVNAFLIGVWALSGAGYFWPIWVILGWGIGLAGHAWATYGRKPITEADVQAEMGKGNDTVA
jgi:hypothetical protein